MKNIGQVGILAVGKCQKELCFFFLFLIFIYLAVLSLSFTMMQDLVSFAPKIRSVLGVHWKD